MSVGRITMIEWTSDEAMQSAFKLYLSTQKKYFPNAEIVAEYTEKDRQFFEAERKAERSS